MSGPLELLLWLVVLVILGPLALELFVYLVLGVAVLMAMFVDKVTP